MELIDTHCHLDRFQKKGELDATLERASSAGVCQVVTIGTSWEDWTLYREMHTARPREVFYTVGLHPADVGEDWREQVGQLSPFFIPPHEPVGLGEIGLDHFHLPKDPIEAAKVIQLQEAAFEEQLHLGLQLDCPLVIHSRNAVRECIRMIDASGVEWERVVFHCWSDGPEMLEAVRKRGGQVSFTGIVTYGNAEEVRESARAVGVSELLLETDAPFLAPVPHRGKRNEPAFVKHTAEGIAETLGTSLEAIADASTSKARDFFKF